MAKRLRKAAGAGSSPCLMAMTEPGRTRDPAALAARLPRGAALTYRPFGAPDRVAVARALRGATRRRGVIFLIGADVDLAERVGADGVHLPERDARRAAAIKRRRPGWIVTAAAHSPQAIRRARRADAVLLSPIFPTRSPRSGAAIGLVRAARWARSGRPAATLALGGVTMGQMRRLRGFAGVAGIDLFGAS